jgi:hypothetical protein
MLLLLLLLNTPSMTRRGTCERIDSHISIGNNGVE